LTTRAGAGPAAAALVVALGWLWAGSCSSPGDSCRSDGDCGARLVCVKPEVDGGPAPSGVCTHPGSGPGDFCRAGADCADGLICSNELPAATSRFDGVCIPLREQGESCAAASNCRPPLECGAAGTCDLPPPQPDGGDTADADTADADTVDAADAAPVD
jgi:hypothetical protein